MHAELKDMQQGDWHARANATGDTASASTCSMGTSGEETSDTVPAAASSRGGDPTATPLRRLSVEQEVDMSVMAGKREPVQSSLSAMDAKQRAALPLATWVVDAWISDSESPDRFGFKYYWQTPNVWLSIKEIIHRGLKAPCPMGAEHCSLN